MIKSRKLQLVIVLFLACICAPVLGAEPNEANTGLKFEIRNQLAQSLRRVNLRAPFESTHVAVLFVRGDMLIYGRNVPIEAMLNTSAGRAMSQKQRDLISNQSIQCIDFGRTTPNYTYFRLFGVSEDDVKKMVEAFIEILTEEANAGMLSLRSQRNELKEKITVVEKEILVIETKIQYVANKLEEVRKKVHYLSSEEAKKTIEELNKTLDELNIEIAGMQVKLKAIAEEHEHMSKEAQKSGDTRKKIYETTIWPRLEQMRIDQIIELKVAEAKKATAVKIRKAAEEFYNLHKQRDEIPNILRPLRKHLSTYKKSLQGIERKLESEVLPLKLKVFQNKVTIYPV